MVTGFVIRIKGGGADFVEDRSALTLDAGGGIEEKRGRPRLPIATARPAGLCLAPLVETPLRLILVPRFYQPGQVCQFTTGHLESPRGHAGGDVESADERPHPAVMVISRAVVFLVSRPPVRMLRQDEGKQVGRKIDCQIAVAANESP